MASSGCSGSTAGSGFGGHPLEIIPYFRRFPRSPARDVLYTLLWNAALAVLFTMIALIFGDVQNPLRVLGDNMVFAQCIGFVIHLLFWTVDWLTGRRMHAGGIWLRTAYYALLPMVGVFIGFWIAYSLLHLDGPRGWMFTPRGIVSTGLLSLVITAIMLAVFIPRERAAKAEAAMAREQARVAAAERETTAARMKLLEAQVEPHFLYNTLAHVKSMIDSEPAGAQTMLDGLIKLLRATAVGASATTTLGSQVELLRAYLEILALRMGSRLAWAIDVPASLNPLPVPPMLLQPVVENAIKHGLEPKLAGGRVDIAATRLADRLFLTVTDTGLGIQTTRAIGSTGLGLSNLRERLAALYGTTAELVIEDNAPSGTRVRIALPLDALARAA
jgi:signal transduction histidine kinase